MRDNIKTKIEEFKDDIERSTKGNKEKIDFELNNYKSKIEEKLTQLDAEERELRELACQARRMSVEANSKSDFLKANQLLESVNAIFEFHRHACDYVDNFRYMSALLCESSKKFIAFQEDDTSLDDNEYVEKSKMPVLMMYLQLENCIQTV